LARERALEELSPTVAPQFRKVKDQLLTRAKLLQLSQRTAREQRSHLLQSTQALRRHQLGECATRYASHPLTLTPTHITPSLSHSPLPPHSHTHSHHTLTPTHITAALSLSHSHLPPHSHTPSPQFCSSSCDGMAALRWRLKRTQPPTGVTACTPTTPPASPPPSHGTPTLGRPTWTR